MGQATGSTGEATQPRSVGRLPTSSASGRPRIASAAGLAVITLPSLS